VEVPCACVPASAGPVVNAPPPPATAILTPTDWTRPLVLDDIFKQDRPVEVDLGCGKGRFITARAKSHPDTNFLGVDRLLARLLRTDRKILEANLSNIRLLRIEVSYAVEYLLPRSSVSVFYVFFPDPWPKRRHHRRRLFTPSFLNALHRTLVPNGLIHVASDHAEYLESIQRLLDEADGFEEVPAFEPAEDERTEFETIFIRQQARIGRHSFRRT
jgi:tRNA (guanine-N7-)-methyltransferase